MSALTKGEKWIRLLRAYGPVADNEAMQAEHVGKLAAHLGVPKLAFDHPARQLILDCFPVSTGSFRNVVLTGTAGEGKTSLCFELVQALTGKSAEGHSGVEIVTVETHAGQRTITLIYDVTAWRKKTNGHLSPEHVGVLDRMAESAFGESGRVLCPRRQRRADARTFPSASCRMRPPRSQAGEEFDWPSRAGRERQRRAPPAHQSEHGPKRRDHGPLPWCRSGPSGMDLLRRRRATSLSSRSLRRFRGTTARSILPKCGPSSSCWRA